MQFLARCWRWPTLAIAVPLALCSWAGNDVRPARPVFNEYQIKAVFLFNFAQFVEWPATAFATTNSPMVIGVLGQNPFGDALDQAVAGEQVGGRSLVVRYGQRVEDLGACQLLFIGRSENERLGPILEKLRGSGVLTVGETELFARAGGIISFVMEQNKVRFAINAEAANREGLRISAKLLRVARVVSNGALREEP